MSRIAAWLVGTAVLMIFLTGYQVTVAGVGGEEQRRPPPASDVQSSVPSDAPGGDTSPAPGSSPTADDKAGDPGAGTDHPPK